MCGILGVVRSEGRPVDLSTLHEMSATIVHRGPDDEGYLFWNPRSREVQILGGATTPEAVYRDSHRYCPEHSIDDKHPDSNASVVLAQRRLSIIDVSASGHQPLCNGDGSLWIIYNGEVYNYQEIRQELEGLGHRFVSGSDTEVVLHAYEEWDTACLSRFNGMFAIAILDTRRNRLFCARDRIGIKPFYYALTEQGFVFGSEIKTLLQSGMLRPRLNLPIVYTYLDAATDDIRETFYEDVIPLNPGHFLTIDLDGRNLAIERYYELPDGSNRIKLSSDDFAAGFLEQFTRSVRYRLIADVPIGTCLSGGLDSSSIVCVVDKLMRDDGLKIPGSDLQSTFSARYEDSRYDEGEWIDQVVGATQSRPYVIHPTGKKLLEELDDLIYHHEEPFGGTSIYAQWSVFKLVKQSKDVGVKVTLDGQGGDELLGGYHRYFATYLANLVRRFQFGRALSEATSIRDLHGYPRRALALQMAAVMAPLAVRRRLKQLSGRSDHPNWLDPRFSSRFAPDPGVLQRRREFYQWDTGNVFNADLARSVRYGIPRLLRHGDRNSMAHSIESRVPFLDHNLVEFCFSLPDEQKISEGKTKVVLREAMKGLLPDPVRLRHSKLGFPTPQAEWLREDLGDLVEDVLRSESFADRGFFDVAKARSLWASHRAGHINASDDIWKWINLELCMRRFID